MNLTLTKKDGSGTASVPEHKYDIALAKGNFNEVDDVIIIDEVAYALSTMVREVTLDDLAAGDAAANEIIKRNAGNTAWEYAADATGA